MQNPSLLLVLATLFWGANIVVGKVSTVAIPPVTLAFSRFFLALLIFLPFTWREFRDSLPAIRKNWRVLTLLGFFGLFGFNGFIYLALQHTTALNAALINSSSPILITLLGIVFLKERISLRHWTGVLMCVTGVLWVITQGRWQNLVNFSFNIGDLLVLAAVFSWSFYSILLRKMKPDLPPNTLLNACIILGGLVMLPFVLLENQDYHWVLNLQPHNYAALLYFALFPSILATLFFNRAILMIGAARCAVYLNLNVLFATLLSIIFLHEALLPAHVAGGAFIIGGILLAAIRSAPAKQDIKPDSSAV